MIKKQCDECKKEISLFPSRYNKSKIHFCSKSCHRIYKNKIDNPSKNRDLSGANNPMWGKHPVAWNKGVMGEKCHNWKGGLRKRKDGYYRINIDGKRYLYHRYLLKDQLKENNVVHHKDSNPSNNNLSNLEILENQSEHAKLHATTRNTKNNS